MKPNLLFIETAAKTCSVGLLYKDRFYHQYLESDQYVHSEKLHVFIESVISEAKCKFEDLQGIVLDKGPGSYTGLRIGTSAVKGLAYALNLPVVSLTSLEIIAHGSKKHSKYHTIDYLIPVLDARRMEVFMQIYDCKSKKFISEIEAKIVETETFKNLSDNNNVLFSGNAVAKLKEFLPKNDQISFDLENRLQAENMIDPAVEKYKNNDFENLAYFEPFYLKEFIAGKPKKMFS